MELDNQPSDPLDDPKLDRVTIDPGELIKRYASGDMLRRDTTHDRAVGMVPSTYDAEAHTVRVILATENPVTRFDWGTGQRYDEVMAMTRKHGDLSRMNASAPYLMDHNSREQIGVWVPGSFKYESIKTKEYEGSALVGTVRFSSRPEVREGIEVDVAEGIRPNHSIGYLPTKVVKTRKADEASGVLEMRRIAWLGFEGSNVAMPADNAAKTRSEKIPTKDRTMTPEEIKELVAKTAKEAAETAARASADAVHAAYATQAQEKESLRTARDLAIRELAESHTLGDAFRDLYMGDGPRAGKSLDQFRSDAMTYVVDRERAHPVVAGIRVEAGDQDERQTWARGAALCLLDNAGYGISEKEGNNKRAHEDSETGISYKHMHMQHRNSKSDAAGYRLDERARQFKGVRVIDLARMCLARGGVNIRSKSDVEIAKMALRHGNGGFDVVDSFGSIMTDTNNMAVNAGYNEAPRTFLDWGERRTAKDFRENIEVGIGEMPTMPQVGEKNEIKTVHFTTSHEAWTLAMFGARWGITFQAIVNDQTGLLIQRGQDFGASAARMQGNLFYGGLGAGEHAAAGCLMGTENMEDGFQLFDDTLVGHRNHVTAGGASGTDVGPPDDLTRINAAGLLLGRQQGFNADVEIDQSMRYLIAARTHSLVAHQILGFVRTPGKVVTQATLAESTPANNEWDNLQIITERRIDASVAPGVVPPFFIAGPQSGLIYAFLQGMESVQVDSRSGWEVLGMEFRGMVPFGCGRRDFRGVVRVDGQ